MLEYFGERLKKARETKGFTRKELAKKMGVSLPTIQAYESITGEQCKPKPPIDRLVQLSEILEVSIDYLCTGKVMAKPDNKLSAKEVLEVFVNTLELLQPKLIQEGTLSDNGFMYNTLEIHFDETLIEFADKWQKIRDSLYDLDRVTYNLAVASLIKSYENYDVVNGILEVAF